MSHYKMESIIHFVCILLIYSIRGEFLTYSYRRISPFDNMLGVGPYLWIKTFGTSLGCALFCSHDKTCSSFFYHAKRKDCRGSSSSCLQPDGAEILENGWIYFIQDSERLNSMSTTFSTTTTLPFGRSKPTTSTTKSTAQPLGPLGCATPPASKLTTCPAFYSYNDSPKLCYRVETSNTHSWHEAKCSCEADGGHLIKIHTKTAWYFIQGILESENACQGYYVGGNDLDVLGTWRWLDDTLVSHSSLEWIPDEPNDEPNHRCMILEPDYNYKLSTATCALQYCYICQIDVTGSGR